MGGSDWKAALPSPLEGRTLLSSLMGNAAGCESGKDNTIYCEYTSEMIPGGWYMIKRGDLKFVYSDKSPLLFDLKTDPQEMTNVVGQEAYKDAAAVLTALAKAKWPDIAALTQRILTSQR